MNRRPLGELGLDEKRPLVGKALAGRQTRRDLRVAAPDRANGHRACHEGVVVDHEDDGAAVQAMERAAQDSWTCATALAEFLARNGVAFHRAHQIVGGLVLESVRQGKKPQDWTLPELKKIAPELDRKSVV